MSSQDNSSQNLKSVKQEIRTELCTPKKEKLEFLSNNLITDSVESFIGQDDCELKKRREN